MATPWCDGGNSSGTGHLQRGENRIDGGASEGRENQEEDQSRLAEKRPRNDRGAPQVHDARRLWNTILIADSIKLRYLVSFPRLRRLRMRMEVHRRREVVINFFGI